MEQDTLQNQLYELLQAPMKIEDIRRMFPNTSKRDLQKALDALLSEGKILKNKKNRYASASHFGCYSGTFLATERGFAFVTPDDESEKEDYFIPHHGVGAAWHGDRVLFKLSARKSRKGKSEATVLKILSRSNGAISGTLMQRGSNYYVLPASKKYPDIMIASENLQNAKAGDRVSAQIQHYGNDKVKPQGEIVAVFGQSGTMESSIAAILHENGVFDFFPSEVIQQAKSIPQMVDYSHLQDRIDLRDRLIFTIDGDDAKDFDDAVSLETLENGHLLLGVHIADVSHYVPQGSLLDEEAYRRGTSVYFPGHVVPMLPFELSHGICSLMPDVERFAFSAFMELGKDGRRYGATFSKSVIRSKARMTYNKVNKILDDDKDLCEQYAFLKDSVTQMNRLAKALHKRRLERGALELDIPESQIIVDENGKPVDLIFRQRGQSEHLIEEFMLMANEAVAEYMQKHDFPTVYRVHENPDPDKLRVFASFARPFGYRVNAGKPEDTAQFQTILNGAKSDPKQRILPMLLLRSLARARYSEECIGHYGLKAKFYLHFTSPIRRYPDLVAHRMLQKALLNASFTQADEAFCEESAKQSTTREQAADNCERNIDKLYIASYMSQFIGEEFSAEVSGVQNFGIFVMLKNGCEGLIRMELLNGDSYEYDEEHMTLYGKHTGKRITIGTPMQVRLLSASDTTGQIDFGPANGSSDDLEFYGKAKRPKKAVFENKRRAPAKSKPMKKPSLRKRNTRKPKA